MPDIFAAVTINNIRSHAYLTGQSAHAKRAGENIELRPGAVPCTQLVWSIHDEDPRDYRAAFKKHKDVTGARERKGAQFGMHLIYVVSAAWLEESGGIHDPENPRVVELFDAARVSAETRFGGVFAVRMDLDEIGSGNVDVFCAPVHTRPGRRKRDGTCGPGTLEFSPRKSLKALQKAYGVKREYEAVQTAWAKDMQVIDPAIKRGEPKAETGREHRDVRDFKAFMDAKNAAEAATRAAEAQIALISAQAAAARQDLSRTQAEVIATREGLDTRRREDEDRRRIVDKVVAEAAAERQKLRDEAGLLAAREAAQRAEADRLTAESTRLQEQARDLALWRARNDEVEKAAHRQRIADDERRREVEALEHKNAVSARELSGRAQDLFLAEAELARKQLGAHLLMQEAKRSAGRLEQVEAERDLERQRGDRSNAKIAAIGKGMQKIEDGGLVSPDDIAADKSLSPAAGFLTLFLDTIKRAKAASVAEADRRTREAETIAAAAKAKAEEAEARAAKAEARSQAVANGVNELRRGAESILSALARFRLPPDVQQKIAALDNVITRLFGARTPVALASDRNLGRG